MTAQVAVEAAPARLGPREGLGAFWRRLARSRLAAAGLAFLVVVSAGAALAPYLGLYPPDFIEMGQRLKGPGGSHPLGTDETGRDVLSRLIWGGRVTLAIGLVAMLLS